MRRYVLPLVLLAFLFPAAVAKELPDIRKVPQDLKTPAMEEGRPAPGKRVKMVADKYKDTDIYHALYLPRDWKKGKKYPVIVEYAGVS